MGAYADVADIDADVKDTVDADANATVPPVLSYR